MRGISCFIPGAGLACLFICYYFMCETRCGFLQSSSRVEL